jgi:hypothetical protein
MRNLASSFVRSSPSYTGSTTLDESGCGSSTFFGMYAIVHVGKGTTCYQLLAKSASYYHLRAQIASMRWVASPPERGENKSRARACTSPVPSRCFGCGAWF